MSARTGIEWTDATWSPLVGCTQVSPGCAHCYAKTMHDRRHKAYTEGKLQHVPQYAQPFEVVQLLEQRLADPLHWRTPRRVFVNSQADLFHDDVPDTFIAALVGVMAACPQHTFQVLTKRADRMRRVMRQLTLSEAFLRAALALDHEGFMAWRRSSVSPPWPLPNLWLGVSVEAQRWADERIPLLLDTPAAVRWLSCEPLLGAVDLGRWLQVDPATLDGWPEGGPVNLIDWVVCGGESGPDHRPLDLDHARALRDQCVAAGVPFLFKQVGGRTAKSGGRVLDGRTWDEYPATPQRVG